LTPIAVIGSTAEGWHVTMWTENEGYLGKLEARNVAIGKKDVEDVEMKESTTWFNNAARRSTTRRKVVPRLSLQLTAIS